VGFNHCAGSVVKRGDEADGQVGAKTAHD
jgi:hypothetical protein